MASTRNPSRDLLHGDQSVAAREGLAYSWNEVHGVLSFERRQSEYVHAATAGWARRSPAAPPLTSTCTTRINPFQQWAVTTAVARQRWQGPGTSGRLNPATMSWCTRAPSSSSHWP